MKKELCIIIPMYNVEKYIEKAVKSITESNLSSDFYDILIVNDGSTDKGVEIVEELAKNLPNLILLNQENGGASKARNKGIDTANSNYIWFVDSDDRVEKDISIIKKNIENHPDVDIFLYSYNWINENGICIGQGSTQPKVKHNIVITGREAIRQGYTPGSVCGLIIRKDYLNSIGLKFVEGITHEDVVFTFELFAKAVKVYFSDDIIYNYDFRTGSVTKATDMQKFIKYNVDEAIVPTFFYNLSESFNRTDPELSKLIRQYADDAVFGLVYNLYRKRKTWIPLGVNRAVLTKLKEDGLYPLKGTFESWKKRIMSIFLNIEHLIS